MSAIAIDASLALMYRIDRTAVRAKDVSEAELDALIDEATEYVRRHAA